MLHWSGSKEVGYSFVVHQEICYSVQFSQFLGQCNLKSELLACGAYYPISAVNLVLMLFVGRLLANQFHDSLSVITDCQTDRPGVVYSQKS